MHLFVIRHGETALNAARVVQTPETPLSERGVAQAERLARRLAKDGVARIMSSDLPRAAMTAQIIADATGAPMQFDPGLQERNFGDVRGVAYDDIGTNPFGPDYVPPNGESWDQFWLRVQGTWGRLRLAIEDAGGNVALVTHGLVCHALASRHLTVEQGVEVPLRWANASLTVADAAPPWLIRLLNCTAHLDADATSSRAII